MELKELQLRTMVIYGFMGLGADFCEDAFVGSISSRELLSKNAKNLKTDRLRSLPGRLHALPEVEGVDLACLLGDCGEGSSQAAGRAPPWRAVEGMDANPFEGIQAPRGVRSIAVRFYTADAMQQLYAANASRANLWRFMAHTGIRRGDLMHLRHENVVTGRLLVESDPDEDGDGRTKSGNWREVPLNAHAAAPLATLLDPLVSVHKDTVSDWSKDDATAAGVGGSLHRLRHTFCAHMVMAGVPLRCVQLLAGHADYATTEKYYAHLTPEGDDGAVAKLTY